MHRGRHGASLADRAARSGAGLPAPAEPPAGTAAAPTRAGPAAGQAPGRHCWVRDPADAPDNRPGLLVEWRQRDDGWHGRVAYTVLGAHGPVLVEAWLPADRLEQA